MGNSVLLDGQGQPGTVMEIQGKNATVAFGQLKTTVKLSRLQPTLRKAASGAQKSASFISVDTSNRMRERQLQFKQEIDVRGMRVDEALQAVTYFIDDAIQFNSSRVRILHGTGTGALRQYIRSYLDGVAGVKATTMKTYAWEAPASRLWNSERRRLLGALVSARKLLVQARFQTGFLGEYRNKRGLRFVAHTFGYGLDGQMAVVLIVLKPPHGLLDTVFVDKAAEIHAVFLVYYFRYIAGVRINGGSQTVDAAVWVAIKIRVFCHLVYFFEQQLALFFRNQRLAFCSLLGIPEQRSRFLEFAYLVFKRAYAFGITGFRLQQLYVALIQVDVGGGQLALLAPQSQRKQHYYGQHGKKGDYPVPLQGVGIVERAMVYASLFCSYKACEFFIMFRVSWLNSESETDRYSDLHCSASVFSPIRS